MAKIIAISGTHGSGKSTLISSLASVKYQIPQTLGAGIQQLSIYIDDFKVSRSVQADFGVTLAEAEKDLPTLKRFQEEIIKRKYEHDSELKHRPEDVVIVERSGIDILVYCALWFQKNLICGIDNYKWFNTYKLQVFNLQKIYDGVVFVPAHPGIPFIAEENRAPEDNRELFETTFSNILIGTMLENDMLQPFTVIKALDLDKRVEHVLSFINTITIGDK